MLRVVFMGTPAFSVPVLAEIAGAGHDVAAVYTRAPKPAGRRGLAEVRSPVHDFAQAAGMDVLCPASLRNETVARVFAAHGADVAVVVAYGLLLPKQILEAPREGCLNLHASALPRWRGAAPIQRAIMAGDSETAALVMRMDEKLDTGPICLAEQVAIGPDMTAGELHDRLSEIGAGVMVRALAALERASLTCTAQPDDGASYAAKIDKSEARIDFSKPAAQVHNQIRGLSPFPGAWCSVLLGRARERVKLLRSQLADGDGAAGQVLDDRLTIACGEGALRLTRLQRAGRRPMSASEFLRGAPLKVGDRLD